MFSNKLRSTSAVTFVIVLVSILLLSAGLRERAEAQTRISPPGITDPTDSLVSFSYMLELDGVVAGYFTECSGIGSENEIVEHRVVDANGVEIVRKIPGRLKWMDVSLRRGITSNLDAWAWRAQVERGEMQTARKNGSIIMLDRDYQEVARWDFTNGWPSRVVGGGDIAMEEITIVHEGMTRAN